MPHENIIIRAYRGFWVNIDTLSRVTDDIAKAAMIRGMNSFNELFTAFISKVLAILAPLPSAFNMARIMIDTYHRQVWEGVILAAVLDLIGYGLTEKAVSWWFNAHVPVLKKRIAVALTVAYYIMLFAIVWLIEGAGVAMIFPLLSVIAALFYALVRHEETTQLPSENERNSEEIASNSNVQLPQLPSNNNQQVASNSDAESRRKMQLQLRANGIVIGKELSEKSGVIAPTISKDKKWLESKQYIDGNGNPTDAGMQWLQGGEIANELPQVAQPVLNGSH